MFKTYFNPFGLCGFMQVNLNLFSHHRCRMQPTSHLLWKPSDPSLQKVNSYKQVVMAVSTHSQLINISQQIILPQIYEIAEIKLWASFSVPCGLYALRTENSHLKYSIQCFFVDFIKLGNHLVILEHFHDVFLISLSRVCVCLYFP